MEGWREGWRGGGRGGGVEGGVEGWRGGGGWRGWRGGGVEGWREYNFRGSGGLAALHILKATPYGCGDVPGIHVVHGFGDLRSLHCFEDLVLGFIADLVIFDQYSDEKSEDRRSRVFTKVTKGPGWKWCMSVHVLQRRTSSMLRTCSGWGWAMACKI